ncbi:MAG TPA: mechanosensitive ion channel protein MscS [Flavobacteriales bacterium]|mgnify:CR=1 FL=1|nr:mechanosensitive ion channel protein MscS [Flavobacteriales bacterium]|tara:strand:+ start:1826 stop:3082 length:1257 start_codon:yes stop_codon:yes gene_type:complete
MLTSISSALEKLLVNTLGVNPEGAFLTKTLILVLAAAVILYVVWRVSKWLLLRWIPKATKRTKTEWDDIILNNRVIAAIALLIPVMLLDYLAPSIFAGIWQVIPFVKGTTDVIMVFTVAWIVASVFNSVNEILAGNPDFVDKPIGSFTQLGKIFVYSIASVLAISIVFDKSPIYLLSGFGAVAAVVLLVFKDSILGFVASIQLSANNMVQVGDWVTVPKYNADGDVLEINLTTIKVQNFNLTITTIPTYAFVADSFTNWRGMEMSNGRRIKRAIHIQMNSIKFCNAETLERFQKIQLVSEHIVKRQAEIDLYNKEHKVDGSVMANGRKLTNIGVFSVYLENYLMSNPNINQKMTIMVRQLSPAASGLPLEIYAFSIHKDWKVYEGVISDIFDHVIAAASEFDLNIFENPTGTDFQKLS